MKKIIDVSGFGHTGKSAVSEFLMDHEDFFAFPIHVEFELFRVRGGLVDLYYTLFHNWNLIRSKESLLAFQKLILRIGKVQNYKKFSTLWNSSGHGYNQYFNDKFIEISLKYFEKLIILEQDTFWPYEKLYLSKFNLLLEKIKGKLFKKILTKKVFFTNRNYFLETTSNYIHSLFNEIKCNNVNNIVLSNAFEPYNPGTCLKMVKNSYSIIVDRDPRDIYASLIDQNHGFIPNFENNEIYSKLKKMIVGVKNIDEFILRYKTIKNNVEQDINPHILRINYEDFILKHEQVQKIIYDFLGISNYTLKKNIKFNPINSKNNIGIWKKYQHLPEIKKIQIELAEFCYSE